MSTLARHSSAIIEIRISSEIERNSGTLVEQAEKLLDGKTQALIKTTYKLEENQLRNVMAVANNSEHVAVVSNFIKYQMGRNEGKNPWNEKGAGFGDALIEALNNLKDIARNIAGKASDRVDEIHIKLVRLFLGYLNRYFVYLNQKEIGRAWEQQRQANYPGRQDRKEGRDRR